MRPAADTRGMPDNVDHRLQAHWKACRERRDEARKLLPHEWAQSARAPGDHLGDLFDDVLERARERIVSQRQELQLVRERGFDLDPAS